MEPRMNRDLRHSVKPWTLFIKRRSMFLRYSVTDTRLKTSIRRWKWLTGLWTKKRLRSPCISAEVSFRKFCRLARNCSFNHFPRRDKPFSPGEKVPVRADEGFRKALTSALCPPTFMVHLSHLAWGQYPVNGFCDYAYGFMQNDRNDISNERSLFQSNSYFFSLLLKFFLEPMTLL